MFARALLLHVMLATLYICQHSSVPCDSGSIWYLSAIFRFQSRQLYFLHSLAFRNFPCNGPMPVLICYTKCMTAAIKPNFDIANYLRSVTLDLTPFIVFTDYFHSCSMPVASVVLRCFRTSTCIRVFMVSSIQFRCAVMLY